MSISRENNKHTTRESSATINIEHLASSLKNGAYFISFSLILIIPVLGYVFLGPSDESAAISLNILLIAFILGITVGPYIDFWITSLIDKFKEIDKNLINIQNTSLEETLVISEDIAQIIQSILSTKKNLYLIVISVMNNINLDSYLDTKILEMLHILWILKDNLKGGIDSQIQVLKSSKEELIENFSKTKEYSHIATTQSVRLDQQISQFEELQKVLVKI